MRFSGIFWLQAVTTCAALMTAPGLSHARTGALNGGDFPFATRSATHHSPLGIFQSKLVASDGAPDDIFAFSAALRGDTAVLGGPFMLNFQGAAYVFTRSDDGWTQQVKLVRSDIDPQGHPSAFGWSLALDGDTLLVGAPYTEVNDNGQQGAVYVFVRTDDVWTEVAKLVASDGTALENFGFSVALENGTAFVGAPELPPLAGAVYVFSGEGSNWTERTKLVASDGAAGDGFGVTLALDDGTVLIGAQNANNFQGTAYVFVGADANWNEQAKLTATDGTAYDAFGVSVALSDDTALVGASGYQNVGDPRPGAAYVFRRSGEKWTQTVRLAQAGGADLDGFGASVALQDDTALIGAFGSDVNLPDSGATWLYFHEGTDWAEQPVLLPDDAQPGDGFGTNVVLDGHTALIAAAIATVNDNPQQGAAYVVVVDRVFASDFEESTP